LNVVTVNVALVAPAGTVTLGGTLAEPGSWLPRLTRTPPVGAAADNPTVPVEEVPPVTLAGLTVKEESEIPDGGGGGGDIVKDALRAVPLNEAEIVAVVVAVIVLRVLTVKVVLVAPAATTTEGDESIACTASLEERSTVAPPLGAAALNVTVPVEVLPPTTLVGLSDSAETVAAGAAPAVISNSADTPGLPARSAKTFMLNVPSASVRGAVVIVKLALV
jgi:hypothetical protein